MPRRRPEQALLDALAALATHARRRHDARAVALCDTLLAEVKAWAAGVARDCAEAEKRLAAATNGRVNHASPVQRHL